MSAKRWSLVVAAASALVARLIAHYALGDVPHVMDEIAYVFQAKTYLTGHVTAPIALPRAAFALWFVDDRTSRYGIFPPGWPAVMAIGVALHLRAWVNPVLHGLTTFSLGSTARRASTERAGILTSVLYGLSPQALFLAASLMSHTLVAFGAALALSAGVAALTGSARPRQLAIGGAGIAIALLSRPLCGVVIASGFAALSFVAWRTKRSSARSLVPVLVPIVLGVALLFAYNRAITGSAMRFPQTVWFDEHIPPTQDPYFRYRPGCNELGFGPGHGCDEGIRNATHDLPNALSNTGDNLISWLFLAGGGPLSLLAPLLAIRLAEGDERKKRAAIFVMVPAAIFFYALYWYAGTCYGARFYHAALPALIMLGGIALCDLDRIRRHATRTATIAWIALTIPGFAYGLSEISDHYWGTDDRFARAAENWNKGSAVVMVAFRTPGLPMHHLRVTGFTSKSPNSIWHNSVRVLSALVLDGVALDEKSVALDDELTFVKFHPALVPELRAKYPNRAFYMYLMADLPQNDVVEPYGPKWSDLNAPMPADNFDGTILAD